MSKLYLELGVFPVIGSVVKKDSVEELFCDELFNCNSKLIKGFGRRTFREIQEEFTKNDPSLAEIRKGIKVCLRKMLIFFFYFIFSDYQHNSRTPYRRWTNGCQWYFGRSSQYF